LVLFLIIWCGCYAATLLRCYDATLLRTPEAELEHRVKKEFILLYLDSQFLNNYHNRFIQNIVDNQYKIITENRKSYVILNPEEPNLEIPSIPKLGDLDIENIIKSKYMIS